MLDTIVTAYGTVNLSACLYKLKSFVEITPFYPYMPYALKFLFLPSFVFPQGINMQEKCVRVSQFYPSDPIHEPAFTCSRSLFLGPEGVLRLVLGSSR